MYHQFALLQCWRYPNCCRRINWPFFTCIPWHCLVLCSLWHLLAWLFHPWGFPSSSFTRVSPYSCRFFCHDWNFYSLCFYKSFRSSRSFYFVTYVPCQLSRLPPSVHLLPLLHLPFLLHLIHLVFLLHLVHLLLLHLLHLILLLHLLYLLLPHLIDVPEADVHAPRK